MKVRIDQGETNENRAWWC